MLGTALSPRRIETAKLYRKGTPLASSETTRLPWRLQSYVEESFGHRLGALRLVYGEKADAFLRSAGALASAVNDDTILLSNGFRALSTTLRALIFAHELAHAVQLSRPGKDRACHLEQEAWMAAGALLCGTRFGIQGAASGPLFAKAIVAMGGDLDGTALLHYNQFKYERMLAAGGCLVTSVKIVPSIDWSHVLDELIAGMQDIADRSLVLCAHGNKEGLTMPVISGSAFKANTATLRFLMQPNAGSLKPTAPKGVTPPSQAQNMELINKMQQVRTLSLVHVEFRGCSIGADYANLEALREFLGAVSVSGPNIKSAWAKVQPKVMSAKTFDVWNKRTRGVEVSTFPAGRCGVSVDWGSRKVHFATDSKDAVPFWLKKRFFKFPAFADPPLSESWMDAFSLHGLHATPLILPLDSAFADHINRVVLTPNGLVHMDGRTSP